MWHYNSVHGQTILTDQGHLEWCHESAAGVLSPEAPVVKTSFEIVTRAQTSAKFDDSECGAGWANAEGLGGIGARTSAYNGSTLTCGEAADGEAMGMTWIAVLRRSQQQRARGGGQFQGWWW